MQLVGKVTRKKRVNRPFPASQYFGHLMQKADLLEKTRTLGKIEGRKKKGMTEDEMVGWHHPPNGHEFE